MTLIVVSRPAPVVGPEALYQTFWDLALPDNATIDPNSTNAVAELAAQAARNKPNLNVWSWTAAHIRVTNDTPRVPVVCGSQDSHLNAMFAAGVPIPDGTQPTNDSDSALLILNVDSGEYWEMQAAHLISGTWHCNFGGKMTNVLGARSGHYVNYTSGPSGTYELSSWGTQGSGLPYWPGEITPQDIDRGYCNHAILLEVIDALKGAHVWPAIARSDGGLASSNVIEGQRYRLAPNYPVPNGHPIGQCVVRTLSKFGAFITDRTANNLCMRATPDCGPYLGSTPDYDVLDCVPWADLQLLTPGSDSNPIPTS